MEPKKAPRTSSEGTPRGPAGHGNALTGEALPDSHQGTSHAGGAEGRYGAIRDKEPDTDSNQQKA